VSVSPQAAPPRGQRTHPFGDTVPDHSPAPLRFGLYEVELNMPTTDYIRHAAKLARKLYLDSAMGTPPAPDPEFFKTLAKALEDIADGLEQVAKRRD
jgi:hypothetical protein